MIGASTAGVHRLFLSAEAGGAPLHRIRYHIHGFQHFERHARDRRIEDRAAELAVFDFKAGGNAEHELTRGVRLTVVRVDEVIAVVDRGDHVFEFIRSGVDRRVAHTDERLVGERPRACVARRLHAEMLGGLAAVHVADQNAVFDDRRIHGGRALVIEIHRQRCFFAERSVRKVGKADLLGGDYLAQIRACDTAAQHEIGFHRVSDGFVCQHAGKFTREDTNLLAGFGVYALALFHKTFVQRVDARMERCGILEVLIKRARRAEHLEHFDRGAVRRLAVEEHVYITARQDRVSAHAVVREENLLHGVCRGDHRTARKRRVFLEDVRVDLFGEIRVQLLIGIGNIGKRREDAARDGRERAFASADAAIHEVCVFVCRFEDGGHRLLGAFRHRGESVHAVFVYACGHARRLRSCIRGQIAGEKRYA